MPNWVLILLRHYDVTECARDNALPHDVSLDINGQRHGTLLAAAYEIVCEINNATRIALMVYRTQSEVYENVDLRQIASEAALS